jgi:hypothetical protein
MLFSSVIVFELRSNSDVRAPGAIVVFGKQT